MATYNNVTWQNGNTISGVPAYGKIDTSVVSTAIYGNMTFSFTHQENTYYNVYIIDDRTQGDFSRWYTIEDEWNWGITENCIEFTVNGCPYRVLYANMVIGYYNKNGKWDIYIEGKKNPPGGTVITLQVNNGVFSVYYDGVLQMQGNDVNHVTDNGSAYYMVYTVCIGPYYVGSIPTSTFDLSKLSYTPNLFDSYKDDKQLMYGYIPT